MGKAVHGAAASGVPTAVLVHELVALRRRIAELEAELAVLRALGPAADPDQPGCPPRSSASQQPTSTPVAG